MPTDIAFSVTDRRKQGYFTIDNVLLDIYGKELGPHGIAVYAALARFANQESECWPTYRTITERTGVSRAQIARETAKLKSLGIIDVVAQVDDKGERKANLYILLDIVGGWSQPETGGSLTERPPSITERHRTIPNKKDMPKSKKKEEKKDYRPAEYSDIILG